MQCCDVTPHHTRAFASYTSAVTSAHGCYPAATIALPHLQAFHCLDWLWLQTLPECSLAFVFPKVNNDACVTEEAEPAAARPTTQDAGTAIPAIQDLVGIPDDLSAEALVRKV